MELKVGCAVNTFGLEVTPEAREVVALARLVDEKGFDSTWVGDHLIFHRPLHEALAMMAAIAASTERVSVGSGILLGVLRDPVWLAKSLSAIDHLSQGRLLLALGVGGEYPPEFEAVGVPVRQRGSRTSELIEALRAIWAGRPDDFEGKYLSVPAQPIQPQPLQAHVPIWVGGRSEAALRRTARFGDGWFSAFVTLPHFQRGLAQLIELAEEAERDPGEITPAFHTYIRVANDDSAAWSVASDFLGTLYNMDPTALRSHCVCGDIDQCVEQLQAYVEAGAVHLSLRVAGDDQAEQIELLAELAKRLKSGSPSPTSATSQVAATKEK